MSETQNMNRLSEASQRLLRDMNQTEIFELCENTKKLQCQDCKSFTEVGIIFCRCGRNLKYNRSPKPNLDCNSIDGYILRKNCSRGTERQEKFFKSKDMLRKAKKRNFPTFLARWQEQESYRSSLKDHGIGEQEIIIYDRLAFERHDFSATKAARMRYSQNWVLTLNAEGKQPPRQLRPDYEEAKRECQRQQDEFMAAKAQLFTPFYARKQRRKNPNQQFQGSKAYDYVVDRKTGWRRHKEQQGRPAAYFVFVVYIMARSHLAMEVMVVAFLAYDEQ